MKKMIKKIAAFLLAAIIVVPAAADVSAASSVSVTGGDNISGGDIFTVTVTYKADEIGRVVGDLTYDTDMLTYISGGSSSGNVGYVELSTAGTGEPLVFKLKFQALKEGSTQVSVSTSELYDLGEMFLDTPSAVKTITISGNAQDDEIVEETNPEDDAADEAIGVDEKEDSSEGMSGGEDTDSADADNSGFLAKVIMLGVGILILILIIVMIFRRRK